MSPCTCILIAHMLARARAVAVSALSNWVKESHNSKQKDSRTVEQPPAHCSTALCFVWREQRQNLTLRVHGGNACR